jgi:hypothetical protein
MRPFFLNVSIAALLLLAWAAAQRAETQPKPATRRLDVIALDAPHVFLDPAGNRIPNVTVTIRDEATGRIAAVLLSDRFGDWGVLLFPGRYRVSARHRFWTFTPAFYGVEVTPETARVSGSRCPFVVAAGRK